MRSCRFMIWSNSCIDCIPNYFSSVVKDLFSSQAPVLGPMFTVINGDGWNLNLPNPKEVQKTVRDLCKGEFDKDLALELGAQTYVF